jgi:hypothetical protein
MNAGTLKKLDEANFTQQLKVTELRISRLLPANYETVMLRYATFQNSYQHGQYQN